MSYVAAYGGTIAKFDSAGNWHGTLEDPKAQQGIQHFVDLVKRYNHGDPTVNEQHLPGSSRRPRAGPRWRSRTCWRPCSPRSWPALR
ncbi:hypothetical protein P3T35_003660 [Kitasatospora sp. GP30]|nr:hypothetical protein [Kitasatospora sp. GP30]